MQYETAQPPLEQRVAALLEASPEIAVPLRSLQRALEASGPRYGLIELRDRLRAAGFVVMEPPAAYDAAPEGDPAFRDAVRRLRQEADARVALAPEWSVIEPSVEGTLRLMADSLIDLWRAAERQPALRAEILDAMEIAAELRRNLMGTPPAESG